MSHTQAKFSQDELLTALIEIEMVLNSRPLTYIAEGDVEEPLTPSHLLIGRHLMNFPDHVLHSTGEDSDFDDINLSARVNHLNHSLESFWKRWRREYLLELREAHRIRRSDSRQQISEGDVVVVYSDKQPRSCWSIGRVKCVIKGNDGQARAASVRVSVKGRPKTLNRPVQHLYPLEVVSSCTDNESLTREDTHCVTDPNSDVDPKESSARPQRSTAAQARDCIFAQTVLD